MNNKMMTCSQFVRSYKCDDNRYTVGEVVNKFYQDRFNYKVQHSGCNMHTVYIEDWNGNRIIIDDEENINHKY